MTVRDSCIVVQASSLHLQPGRLHHKRGIAHGHIDEVLTEPQASAPGPDCSPGQKIKPGANASGSVKRVRARSRPGRGCWGRASRDALELALNSDDLDRRCGDAAVGE